MIDCRMIFKKSFSTESFKKRDLREEKEKKRLQNDLQQND